MIRGAPSIYCSYRRFCQPLRHRVDRARCCALWGLERNAVPGMWLLASGLSGQRKASVGTGAGTAASSSTSAVSVCSTVPSIRAMSSHSWCLAVRYKLSLRDLAEMFLTRGFIFSYEAVRDWEATDAGACRDPTSATQRQGRPQLVP
jgi:hypothetical protein